MCPSTPNPPDHASEQIVRSIFISDLHLGSRFSRSDDLLVFLNRYRPTHLYLVGDFIDAWALQRQWHWPDRYHQLIVRVIELAENGTTVFYTPGNHDDYLRERLRQIDSVTLEDEFVHTGADGRRMLVIHGDQFDDVETKARWLSKVGSAFYDAMLLGDRVIGIGLRSVGLRPRPISHRVKRLVKKVVQRISGFEKRLVHHAGQRDCQIAICGHLHRPQDRMLGATRYINLGDWVENASALLEHSDGRLELIQLNHSELLPLSHSKVADAEPAQLAAAEAWAADLLVGGGFDHPLRAVPPAVPSDRG